MKKNVITWLLTLVIILGAVLSFPMNVYADGTVNVSVSSTSGTVGEQVAVDLKVSSANKFYSQIYISYDTSVLQLVGVVDSSGDDVEYGGGGGGTIQIIGDSATKSVTWKLKFKLLKVGSSSVKVMDNTLFLDEDESKMTTSPTNGTVTVKAPVNYSGDNSLKSLTVSPGTLTPAFSPDITEYTLDVTASCYKLTVSAVPNHSKATVGVAGVDIKEGKNTTTITVTAENGSKKNYVITTNKPITPTEGYTSAPKKMCEYNGEHYFINQDYTITQLPGGFTRTEITYQGETMYVGKNAGGLSIMYLEHTITGVGAFYVYDTVKEKFYPFVRVMWPDREYIVLEITDEMEKPQGFELEEAKIGEKTAKVLKNGDSDFYVFYGMNDEGKTGWYSYDSKEGTIQRYSGVAPVINDDTVGDTSGGADDGEDKDTATGDNWKDVAIIAIIVAAVLFVFMLIFMMKASRNNKEDSHREMLKAVAAAKVAEASESLSGASSDEDEEEDDEEDEYDEVEYEEYDALEDNVDADEVLEIGEVPEEDDGDVLLDDEPNKVEDILSDDDDIEVVEIEEK